MDGEISYSKYSTPLPSNLLISYLYHEEYREVGKEYHLKLTNGQEKFGNNGLT